MAGRGTRQSSREPDSVAGFVSATAEPGRDDFEAVIIPFPGTRMYRLTRLVMQTETALIEASHGIPRHEADFLECSYDHARCRFHIDEYSYVEVPDRSDFYRFVSQAGKGERAEFGGDELDRMAEFIVEYILGRVFEERRRRAAC